MIKKTLKVFLASVFALSGIVANSAELKKSDETSVGSGQPGKQNENKVNQSQPVQSAGRTAYIDPVTGKLRSGPADPAQAIQQDSQVTGESNLPPMKVTTHPNGMVQVDLNGRFRIPLQATIGCDGEVTTEHSDQSLPEEPNCEAGK